MTDNLFDERREFPRTEASFQVAYHTLDELVVGYTQNLSKGGVFVSTEQLLPINSIIKLNIKLTEEGGDFSCIARVVHIRGKGEREKPSGMAVEFLEIPEDGLRFIEDFITQRVEESIGRKEKPIERRALSIVVVDDDPHYRELVASAFQAREDHVVVAADGIEGLAACLKKTPDVIVTDVQMPRMDGWSLLRTIRSRPSLSSVIVVFQTSLKDEEDRLRGYQLGVDDYLGKPYSVEELTARIDRLIERSSPFRRHGSDIKALRGDLTQVSLATICSMLEYEKRTGVILIVGPDTGRVFVRNGKPVAIEVAGMQNEKDPIALAVELFCWEKGIFEFVPLEVSRSDSIGLSMQGLLMEVARITDESRRTPGS